jgi:hypothetical protein
MQFDRGIVTRIVVSVLLAAAAVSLYVFSSQTTIPPPRAAECDFASVLDSIDKQVDAVLASYGVEPSSVKRKEFVEPEERFVRVERRVLIPPTVIPATVNRDLNLLARQYRGRAVATENLRENSVTIHILVQENVVQTVILKVHQDNRKKQQREQSRKV